MPRMAVQPMELLEENLASEIMGYLKDKRSSKFSPRLAKLTLKIIVSEHITSTQEPERQVESGGIRSGVLNRISLYLISTILEGKKNLKTAVSFVKDLSELIEDETGLYHLINSIAVHLRYQNKHSQAAAELLKGLFGLSGSAALPEMVLRTLLEKMPFCAAKPHPVAVKAAFKLLLNDKQTKTRLDSMQEEDKTLRILITKGIEGLASD